MRISPLLIKEKHPLLKELTQLRLRELEKIAEDIKDIDTEKSKKKDM